MVCEAITKTRKSVSSGIQTPRSRLKSRLVFSTHFDSLPSEYFFEVFYSFCYNYQPVLKPSDVLFIFLRKLTGLLSVFKAAGDKLLMNKFIRQNFGGGRTLKSFRS